jgi:hypothetical protein
MTESQAKNQRPPDHPEEEEYRRKRHKARRSPVAHLLEPQHQSVAECFEYSTTKKKRRPHLTWSIGRGDVPRLFLRLMRSRQPE